MFAIFLIGCDNVPEKEFEGGPSEFEGKLLILQAYASSNTAGGATHSFVEIYNKTQEAITLDGMFLYFADGHKNLLETDTDKPWDRIALTGSIPAEGSFLITGLKQNDTGRLKLTDDYGDIIDDYFVLSNRAFKVALIEGTVNLNTQNILNPFDTDGNGTKADGYIDMVGAINDPVANDAILGFETAPARCSASEAVRRKSLEDKNDNSNDFIAARYGSTDGDRISLTDEEVAVRSPRNSRAGKWNPFADPLPPDNPTVAGEISEYAGDLLILQAGASTDGAITRSFIELYNNSDAPINLNTFSLQYGAVGVNWTVINLTGTVPAKGSYLVTGSLGAITGDSRLYLDNADQTVETFTLSNNGFKVALMENKNKLTVDNPFVMTGGTAAKYVDMLGAYNNNAASVDAFETTVFTPISKQSAARRKSLTDTDNNLNDFERIDYRTSGINDEKLAQVRPRYSVDGSWEPFPEPEPSDNPTVAGEQSEYAGDLLIFQAGASTDGAITRSFVELYNNTDAAINLNTFSLQYGATGANWIVINLTGTVPAKGSYLVTGSLGTTHADNRLFIENADQTVETFSLNNQGFKVALMENQDILTVDNPFAMTGGTAAKYVDMLGAYNSSAASVDAFETTAFTAISKQAAARRKSLEDTDNNVNDFERIDYRRVSGNNGINDDDLEKYRPRYSGDSVWQPFPEPGEPSEPGDAPTGVQIIVSGILGKSLTLSEGDSDVKLSAQFSPSDADATGVTYAWAISDQTPAGVLTSGVLSNEAEFKITAVTKGTAKVTLTVTDGGLTESISDLITVVVNEVETTAPDGSNKLMILQANTHGNDSGGFSKSLVELYNNTNGEINLDTSGYYLHIGDNTTPGWTYVFKLTGTIPAYCSFVIISNNTEINTTPRTTMPAADREYDFVLTNSGFKVALMINQSELLTVANPFTEASLSDDYIDMLGISGSTGFETAGATQSKPQLTRRNSLTDTDNNSVDFTRKDIRSTAMQDSELYKYWPRNSAAGAWNPMTGNIIILP